MLAVVWNLVIVSAAKASGVGLVKAMVGRLRGNAFPRGPWISGEDVVKVFKRLFLKGSVMVDVTGGEI